MIGKSFSPAPKQAPTPTTSQNNTRRLRVGSVSKDMFQACIFSYPLD